MIALQFPQSVDPQMKLFGTLSCCSLMHQANFNSFDQFEAFFLQQTDVLIIIYGSQYISTIVITETEGKNGPPYSVTYGIAVTNEKKRLNWIHKSLAILKRHLTWNNISLNDTQGAKPDFSR